MRKEDGSLHFFVNGVAQGPAAWNVPPSVYAVVDLYGQAAQATIMDDIGERQGDANGNNRLNLMRSEFVTVSSPSLRGQLRGPHGHVPREPLLSRRGQHDQ